MTFYFLAFVVVISSLLGIAQSQAAREKLRLQSAYDWSLMALGDRLHGYERPAICAAAVTTDRLSLGADHSTGDLDPITQSTTRAAGLAARAFGDGEKRINPSDLSVGQSLEELVAATLGRQREARERNIGAATTPSTAGATTTTTTLPLSSASTSIADEENAEQEPEVDADQRARTSERPYFELNDPEDRGKRVRDAIDASLRRLSHAAVSGRLTGAKLYEILLHEIRLQELSAPAVTSTAAANSQPRQSHQLDEENAEMMASPSSAASPSSSQSVEADDNTPAPTTTADRDVTITADAAATAAAAAAINADKTDADNTKRRMYFGESPLEYVPDHRS